MTTGLLTPAVRNQNPGNLKDPSTGTFRSFSDPVEGKAALYNDLTAKMTGTSTTGINGESSLIDFAKVYAPAGDKNDPVQYAANIANKMGISPDDKIGTLLPRIDDFASAVMSNEDPSHTYQQHQPIQSNQSNQITPASQLPPVEYQAPETPTNADGTTQEIPKEKTLGSALGNRIQDVNQAITDTTSGKQHIVSGVLQTVGAGAGAVGDVVNSLIEHTPILGGLVKGLEGAIGSGVTSFLNTDSGKGVLMGVSNFAKDHPELSKDIGAGINIVSAIPILKGLGVAVNLAKDAGAMALKNVAEKAAIEGLSGVNAIGKNGVKYLAKNPNAVTTLVKERAIPEIVDGAYSTKDAYSKLSDSIGEIDDELQTALSKASTEKISQRIPLEQYKNQAMADAVSELKDTAPIEAYFKRIQAKYGDYPTLQDMNEAKRIVAKNISEKGFNSPTYDVDKVVRSALQKSVEDGAEAAGLPDVAEINQRMAELIKAQNVLKYMEGTKVKTGALGSLVQTGATGAGAGVGSFFGVSPEVSAFMGNKLGGLIGKSAKEVPLGILERTGKGAVRTTGKEAVQGVKGTTKGIIGQKIAQ